MDLQRVVVVRPNGSPVERLLRPGGTVRKSFTRGAQLYTTPHAAADQLILLLLLGRDNVKMTML